MVNDILKDHYLKFLWWAEDGPLYCDCCGTVKLAVVRDGKIIIMDKRNRRNHIVSRDLTAIIKER